jgi:serine/threonine protein kinase
VRIKTKPETESVASSDNALRQLCFSDAVFSDRYDGWRLIGRGPWATVVRTRSRDLGQDIALKVFVNLEPESVDRVRLEVRSVQALASPYLVHTYSLFDRGTIAWFEMEWVDGRNLQEEIGRLAGVGERIPLARAYDIALAVSRCVWHAHRHGVLHRDIKPANVLLPASGQPAAKVSDFGTARLADVSPSTPPGTIVGTPRFASPEALAGEPVGPEHDIFALGATLYSLFSGGHPPYDVAPGASLAALRELQFATRPIQLRDLASEIDPGLAGVVMESLESDPRDRPGVRWVVLALEAAQARLLATTDRRNRTASSPFGTWRVAAASASLLMLGFWTRLRRRQRRRGVRPD